MCTPAMYGVCIQGSLTTKRYLEFLDDVRMFVLSRKLEEKDHLYRLGLPCPNGVPNAAIECNLLGGLLSLMVCS